MKKATGNNQDLYDAIYELVRNVPEGRITTYGAIAAAIGMKSGARMVGYALNHCHLAIPAVPAHRVVNHAGLLTGKYHFTDEGEMQRLLEKEGVIIEADKVQDFSRLFWDPVVEWLL